MTAFAMVLGYALVSMGSYSSSAHAETLAFAAGAEANGSAISCFGWSNTSGSPGLYILNDDTQCARHWSIPLYWRNFYSASTNRQIVVRGRRPTSAVYLECNVMAFNSNGVILSSDIKAFPVTGNAYGTITLTVNNIVASGSSYVTCTPQLPSDARLLNIDWSP
jgi:hypothetical protein